MDRQIFSNLAVKNVDASKAFFEGLGFEFNAEFSSEEAACLVVEKNISVMLLSEAHFKNFTHKKIANSKETAEALLCISCQSRDEVDALVAKARALGGNVTREPQDHGFMYGHGFEDIDGHKWELMFMEPNAEQ